MNVSTPCSTSYRRSFNVISPPSSTVRRPASPGSYGVPVTRRSTVTSAFARLLSTTIGDAVSTLTLKRTRSRNALRCSVRSSWRRALIAASRPSSKLMSPVKPASSIVTCPPSTNVSPLFTRRILASERLRKSSGASNATSSVVSSSATSAMPPSPSTTYPDPSSAPAVDRPGETRERDAPAC